MHVTCLLEFGTQLECIKSCYSPWFLTTGREFEWQCSPGDTMMQLHEEDDQQQSARQHPVNRLRYPAEIASVNDQRNGERHLAVSLHPLDIPVTGSLPLPPPFCNHRRKGRAPIDPFPPVHRYPWPRIEPLCNVFCTNTHSDLSRTRDEVLW